MLDRRDPMRGQPLQTRERAEPDVAFVIFEERLHGVAGQSVFNVDDLNARA